MLQIYNKSKGGMKQQHRVSLRILFGACLILTLCLEGNAASSNRPSRGGNRGSSTSSASSSSRSSRSKTLDDEYLDLDDDTNFLFDDENDVGYGLDGQDDMDYPEDDMDGIDFSEGDDDDFDQGGNGLLDDYAEDDGDGQQSSSTEKGALYDAYNLLHSLAQVSVCFSISIFSSLSGFIF